MTKLGLGLGSGPPGLPTDSLPYSRTYYREHPYRLTNAPHQSSFTHDKGT